MPLGWQNENNWCPKTTDDVLPSVLGLLPPGPAWDGAAVAGTYQNQYFRALSSVLAFTYERLCAYVDEFFCATVNESLDQWMAEYGLPDDCDPYGNNLCAKVAASGGAVCSSFVDAAHNSGWVITCADDDTPEPIAGCFEVGCTPLGPTPHYIGGGSNLGIGEINGCNYGEVVAHPDPSHWEHSATPFALCPVPGSNLGQGPDTDESCCFIVGWYEAPTSPIVDRTDFCTTSDTIYFDCPRNNDIQLGVPNPGRSLIDWRDSTGNYSEWGMAYVWDVNLDLAASFALQASNAVIAANAERQRLIQLGITPPAHYTSSQAGDFMAGSIPFTVTNTLYGGTPLCTGDLPSAPPQYVLCLLGLIKPAHTTLNLTVTQP